MDGQEELVRRMQAGDTEAFGRIFDYYGTRLLRMAYLLTGNYADSEDIVQETFETCFFKCGDLKDCSRFTPWLYQILTRNAWRIGRRSRREEPVEELPKSRGQTGLEAERQPLEIIVEDESRAELWKAVQQLSLKMRTVVVLYYYNGLSTKEIARITHCLEGTVKSRLYTARKILERELREGGTAV